MGKKGQFNSKHAGGKPISEVLSVCLTQWRPTHPCCLPCDFSLCCYYKCVCWALWLLFLSPLCKCLTKNINKAPWRVCQQDSYQGGDTCVEPVKRRANPRREARRCVKTSIVRKWKSASSKKSFFTRRTKAYSCYSPGAGCITGPLALLGGNSTNCCTTKTILNCEKKQTWCNTCKMEKSEPETGQIAIKGEKKGRKWETSEFEQWLKRITLSCCRLLHLSALLMDFV